MELKICFKSKTRLLDHLLFMLIMAAIGEIDLFSCLGDFS